jgi:hypothetical protein
MRRWLLSALLPSLLLALLHAAPAQALTLQNASDRVLYCSIYRQGFAMPLTQFVLLPGKKTSWSPLNPNDGPFTVRAVAESRPGSTSEPVTCAVASALDSVVAETEKGRLVLGVAQYMPVR